MAASMKEEEEEVFVQPLELDDNKALRMCIVASAKSQGMDVR
jgi:hypothetical protein